MKNKFQVEGMHCQMCVNKITKGVSEIEGVNKVFVNLEEKTMECEYDQEKVSVDKITKKVEELGFSAKLYNNEEKNDTKITKTKFEVEGMHCQMCVNKITKGVSEIEGVNKVFVKLEEKTMECEYDKEKVSAEKIINTIEELGFSAQIQDKNKKDGINDNNKEDINISKKNIEEKHNKEENKKTVKKKFEVLGMSCEACSAGISKTVSKLDGVINAEVSLMGKSMECEYDEDKITPDEIIKAIEKIGYNASLLGQDKKETKKSDVEFKEVEKYTPVKQRLIISIIFLVVLMYISMGSMMGLPVPSFLKGTENALTFSFLQFLLTLPVIYVNRKFFFVGFKALINRIPNMDTLVAVGSLSALIYGIFSIFMIGYGLGHSDFHLAHKYAMNLYFESSAMILTLVTVGKFLEERSKGKTNNAIKELLNLSPKKALVLRNGKEELISTEDIVVGDIIIIKPGESIPVDGILVEGSSSVDESAITGESIPVEKEIGSNLISATVNKTGYFKMKATKVGADTTLSKIIELVKNASTSKAPIASLADKVASIFVPTVITIAVISVIVWLYLGESFAFALSIGISVLVVSCPCALGLATPVAITVAMGRCAKKGILIKNARALETLHSVNTVVLDKTGTITEGKPEVTKVLTLSGYEDEFIKIAASLEKQSEHPLSEAILNYYGENELYTVSEFNTVSGKGINGKIGEELYYGGNYSYMNSLNVDMSIINNEVEEYIKKGNTPMFFTKNNELLGVIFAADKIRDTSIEAVKKLKSMNIEVKMLTGDNKVTANAIKEKVGLDDVIAEVLPEDKEKVIQEIQNLGKKTVMVGDGINDSPALTRADVGVAIGNGTDIAIESADVVLMKSDLLDVCEAISFSKKTIRNIKENLFWAFSYNIIGIPIAFGILYPKYGITLSPMIAALFMSISSVLVTSNALRLYKK